MSVDIMPSNSSANAFDGDSFFKQVDMDEEFLEGDEDAADGASLVSSARWQMSVKCKLNNYQHVKNTDLHNGNGDVYENGDDEYEYQLVEEGEEFGGGSDGDDDEYEVVEIDESNIMYDDCVLMPFRSRIMTKPQIKIRTKFDFMDTKLTIPPSKCAMTLNERFSELQSKLLTYTINPIFGCGGWHRLTAEQKKNRRSAFSRLGYFFKKRQKYHLNRAQELAAKKLKKRSIKQLNPVVDKDGTVHSKSDYWKTKFRWFNREPKTKEELDEEIDYYMEMKGKIPEEEEDDDDEEAMEEDNDGDGASQGPKPSGKKRKSKFASMVEKIKQWGKNGGLTAEDLDRDLDEYRMHSKSALDQELEEYMLQAAAAKLKKHEDSMQELTSKVQEVSLPPCC